MTELGVVRRLCKEAVDRGYYDRLYVQQLFMSGDKETLKQAISGQALSSSSGVSAYAALELPEYAEIEPNQGKMGANNHTLVNSRINIQGVVGMEPAFILKHPDPVVREVNAEWLLYRWVTQSWDAEFEVAGMELEANGIACVCLGVDDGKVNLKYVSNLDVLFDRSHKTPEKWQWACYRERLSPEKAREIFGDALNDDEYKRVTTGEPIRGHSQSNELERTRAERVVVWNYYDEDTHVVFLKNIHGNDTIVLGYDADLNYVRLSTEEAAEGGPNPYGVIPLCFWVDGWSPSVRRPVAKLDGTLRPAALLSAVEEYIIETMQSGVPITGIDPTAIDEDLYNKVRNIRGFEDVNRLLILLPGTRIEDVLQRLPASEIPAVVLQLREILKQELTAGSGVGDMQRGQALSGERTRFEVASLNDQAGGQARHLRRTFAKLVESVASKARVIGARFDTDPVTLSLPNFGQFDSQVFPLTGFLEEPLPLRVDPAGFTFKSDAQIREDKAKDFALFFQPLVAMGGIDPMKLTKYLLDSLGIKDPERTLMIGPASMMGGVPPTAGDGSQEIPA